MRTLVAIAAVLRVLVPVLVLLSVPITTTLAAGGLTVTTPNGGQKWTIGKQYAIKWSKGTAGASVRISLTKSGRHYQWISKKTRNDGRHTWKIPTSVAAGSAYKIKIKSVKKKKVLDSSNHYFSISNSPRHNLQATGSSGRPRVTTPNGGQSWTIGKSYTIKWNKSTNNRCKGGGRASPYVWISLLKSGSLYKWIGNRAAFPYPDPAVPIAAHNDGRFVWTIPSSVAVGSQYKIRITETDYWDISGKCKLSDRSNRVFTITKSGVVSPAGGGQLKTTTPNGGEKWKSGKKYLIKWDKGNGGTFVRIQLLKSDKHYKWVSKKTKNDGKHPWKIPATIVSGSAYKIKITSTKNKKVFDKSNQPFSISKTGSDDGDESSLKVTSPNGGESLDWGKSYAIKWDKAAAGKFVRIFLLKSTGKRYKTISVKTKNDGKYPWKVAATIAFGSYKIRVQSVSDSTQYDDSDSNFTIEEEESFPSGDYAYLNKHNAYQLGGYTTRWKSKTIQVSGATGSWQSAVNRWPTVSFSHIGSAPAQGNGIEILGYVNGGWTGNQCGLASWSYWSDGRLATCRIKMNPSAFCTDYETEQMLMAHEIGHCIGVFKHTTDGGVMDATIRRGTFTSPIRNMISLLYSLSPGTNINSKFGRRPSAKRRSKNNKYDPTGTRLYSGTSYFMKNGEVRTVPNW